MPRTQRPWGVSFDCSRTHPQVSRRRFPSVAEQQLHLYYISYLILCSALLCYATLCHTSTSMLLSSTVAFGAPPQVPTLHWSLSPLPSRFRLCEELRPLTTTLPPPKLDLKALLQQAIPAHAHRPRTVPRQRLCFISPVDGCRPRPPATLAFQPSCYTRILAP